jgi:hypothetical protein
MVYRDRRCCGSVRCSRDCWRGWHGWVAAETACRWVSEGKHGQAAKGYGNQVALQEAGNRCNMSRARLPQVRRPQCRHKRKRLTDSLTHSPSSLRVQTHL